MKQAHRGLAETARQIFKPAHSKKDSKDRMQGFEPQLNGDVENTTSVYGPLQHDGTNNHTHGHSSDAQNKFFDQLRQAGSVLARKRKDQNERSRKRARDQYNWHDLDIFEESPPVAVPPGFIGRTTSISPPAPIPVIPAMPNYHPNMTGQDFQTAYRNLHNPHATMHAFGEQTRYLARHKSHQLPPIAENELAEREEEELDSLKCPSSTIPSQQRDHSPPAHPLQDEGMGSKDDTNLRHESEDDRHPSSSPHQCQNPSYHHSDVSPMQEEFTGTRSRVSSLSDTEILRAGDDELSRKDRVSLAANQRAMAELDEERERLRRQFEQFSWCHGQEEEFCVYALAADRESMF
ncbi:hypothetical protein AC578_7023 [Pseudocercospora eumusae]|uniref:Uncharacterized protein n=1 Tax=Pseudocercospora eumusae TaxID=321146 RepID=A0A139HCQ3_9PEZI|nr:hypothetical protein AC578_7023 [Pseudocercospora eumusae]